MMPSMILLALALGSSGITLTASSPQTTVLVGEPIKIVVAWTSTVPVVVLPDDQESALLQYVVSCDGGQRVYREFSGSRWATAPLMSLACFKGGF